MRYLLCNFLGTNHVEKVSKHGLNSVIFKGELGEGNICEAVASIDEKAGTLTFSKAGMNEGSVKGIFGGLSSEKVKSTDELLDYSDENPVIAVATTSMKVMEGIPTYIKYITMKDSFIVVLLKGYIEVLSDSGEYVPLTRNIDAVAGTPNSVKYSAEDMKNLNFLEEESTGAKYSDYVVNDCIILNKRTKDNKLTKEAKFTKSNFFVLTDAFSELLKDKEDKKRKHEEMLARQKAEKDAKVIEAKARYSEISARMEAEKTIKKIQEDAKKAADRKALGKKPLKPKESVEEKAESGAKAFLDIIAGLK